MCTFLTLKEIFFSLLYQLRIKDGLKGSLHSLLRKDLSCRILLKNNLFSFLSLPVKFNITPF